MDALLPAEHLGVGRPVRCRNVRRGAVGLADIRPVQDLERTTEAWRSVGTSPTFLLARHFPAGGAYIRLKMTASAQGRLKLIAVQGQGSHSATCLLNIEVCGGVEFDGFFAIDAPVTDLQLQPLDGPGDFRLQTLHIQPLSGLGVLGRALVSKIQLLRKYWHTGQAVRRAWGMVARGDFVQLRDKLLRGLNGPDFENAKPYDETSAYEAWRSNRRLTDSERDRLRRSASALTDAPVFSILLTASSNPGLEGLRRSIESVLRQTYSHWQLCIRCDAAVRPVLSEYVNQDCRVRFADATPDADAEFASAAGDYIALLDDGDELAEHGLSEFGKAVVDEPGLDLLYADEDRLTPDGRHVTPHFKPKWSPESLLAWMYLGRPCFFSASRLRELGGFRTEFGPVREFDLALRLAAKSPSVKHIADVLYHRRIRADHTELPNGEARAIQCHLNETEREGSVEPTAAPSIHRVHFALKGSPLISIVISSACRRVRIRGERTYYLLKCLESIKKSTWPRFEVVVLHNAKVPSPVASRLDRPGVVHAVYNSPFNWSGAMNQGAALARGEHLLFLNDDVEVITADWLERLLEFSQQGGVGAVGAKLFFPSGRIQHAGVAVLDGRPQHSFYGCHGEHSGYFNNLAVPRNCSAVTGACLMSRAEVFHSLGGFDETLALNYNDVDYCLKVVTSGKRIVCTPYARLYHHELGTRPAGVRPEETEAMRRRWGDLWTADPYYNPHLSPSPVDYRIRPVK